ncbi:iron-siderophore ABC transporter substrate-binding protein [Halomonas koreensis]|uniref:Iron-siderophore ABC transporter substrate-binding protein n=1 Tax=Halomonas koreensis TaxID=245385 RepID=A0ABU1G360_9GAMM|nr:iron-siderophore ABC transporter substrate-binding protein [Halomonas koreensis]MDR5867370.1 iron-siderophore ABC transporter substrate-binding protein [Halomonas koreensis]
MPVSLLKPSLRAVACLAAALAVAGPTQARTLDTAHGEVEVPDAPERVVTLYEGALDASLTAGVMPVGAVTTRGGDDVARYLDAHLRDQRPAIVGVVREINLEAVVGERPDLILAGPHLPDAQYALLSKIAPTVVPDSPGLTPDAWKVEARQYGRALGRASAVNDAIAGVEARAAELREDLGDTEAGTANLVRWMPQGPLVMADRLFSSGLLAAVGLEVDAAGLIEGQGPHSDPLSLENLSSLRGDWLFLATLNEEGGEALAVAQASPAFARLPVVEAGRVVPVDGQLWTSASGPLAAEAILDDIEAALLP